MRKVSPLINEEVIFGLNLDDQVNRHLQQAARHVGDPSKSLLALLNARNQASDQLETLVALYKYHFYRGETGEAEDVVFQTLIKAAVQGGFDYHWESLTPESADWRDPSGAGRIYLYTLKALAFIRLRQNFMEQAAAILEAMMYIDPDDRVGASVISDLLEGARETGE